MDNENKKVSEEIAEVAGAVAEGYVQTIITKLKWAAIVAGALAVFVLLCVVFK